MRMRHDPERRPAAARALALGLALGLLAGCAVQTDPEPEPTGSAARPDRTTPVTAPEPTTPEDPAARASRDELALRELYSKVELAEYGQRAISPAAAVADMARMGVPPCCPGDIRWPSEPLDRENYAHLDENPVRLVAEHPVSTFSIDVDTGAYANVRRFLNAGRLPPEDAVRVEELINYFSYTYPVPAQGDRPFTVTTEVAAAPWNADRLLLQIGIKGYEVPAERRPPANLVFLVDVSGSMSPPDKLPLLKSALKMLTRQMTAADRISLVVYAGGTGVVLEPTPGDRQATIMRALDALSAGGRTNGAGGIRAAYQLAEEAYIPDGINRVLLATDGDFNVGTVDFDALIDLVERRRDGGISLTTLGFGTGNYNDQLMEQLADAGNGNHAYIDTLSEGRKVLVDQLGATLQTIAKDVKIQVEFNPAVVAEYRLIGYENRVLNREDFNNDRVDAGEIGAGHTVTALYELALTGSPGRLVDPLRYGQASAPAREGNGELAFVRLRYKAPDGEKSRLIEQAVAASAVRPGAEPGTELRFAAAVAAFGQILRGGDYTGEFTLADVAELAQGARGEDRHGYRGEFLGLVRLAESLGAQADGTSRGSHGSGPRAAMLER